VILARRARQTVAPQSAAAERTINPQATLAFGVVTSGISQAVHPRLTTCSSQKSLAILPAP